MLSNFKCFFKWTNQIIQKCEFQSLQNEKIFNILRGSCFLNNQKQNFHMSMPCTDRSLKILGYRRGQKSAVNKTSVVQTFKGDVNLKREEGFFPTVDLPNTLFNGVPFREIPIIYIKVSRNNTILTLFDDGLSKFYRSCGIEGFKNARKGTNVAAQTSGTALALRASKKGYKCVRVVIKGLGPGRLSAIKGLQLGGLNVISITDNTIDNVSTRAKKQRRL